MSLRARIFDAFVWRPQPEPDQILRPEAGPDGQRLRDLLATKTSEELSSYEIRTELSGNLWMLTPEAFLYFLPGFLQAALESYDAVSVFASDLIGALTEPSRVDIVEAMDRVAQIPPEVGLPPDTTELIRRQQLESFDSGTPVATFRERFQSVTPAEGAAVLEFFAAFEEAHGANFPFDELKVAVDRYWGRFRKQ